MPTIPTRSPAPTPVRDSVPLPPKRPQLPEELFERFPRLREWQDADNRWWSRSVTALQGMVQEISAVTTETRTEGRTLRVRFNEFQATVTEEIEALADADGALARRIVTVSAMAGINQAITVQTTPPGGPSLNDYWIDSSDLTNAVTYRWNGSAWVEVTVPIAFAGVADERTARVTADGFLEGKYTLTVAAGDVVTGMNITSASGPGTNVSQVTFQADKFLIYSGTAAKVMFYADGVQDKVRLANVLTVDGANTAVYVRTASGAGSYNDANTAWFVDANGRMSLKQQFLWDGTNLTINGGGTFSGALSAASGTFAGELTAATGSFSGSVTASSGSIGGWTIGASTLSNNNAILDSAGQLVLGTANDVVYLSATDATYRIWIGNASAGSAAFRVTKEGVMSATGGSFSGSITSTNGTIGGWTLASGALSASGSAGNIVLDAATGQVRVTSGSATGLLYAQNPGPPGDVAHLILSYNLRRLDVACNPATAYISMVDGAGTPTVLIQGETGAMTISGTLGCGDLSAAGTVTAASFSTSGTISATANGQRLADLGFNAGSIEVGVFGSGDRNAFIDLHAANSVDYSARIIRKPGTNGELEIEQTGSGDLYLNGTVKFGTHASIGAETVTGYVEFKTADGTTRKLAVVS